MKKQTLIPVLAIAAVAATLSLPATASADTFKHKETTVLHSDHRDSNVRPVHDDGRRYSESRHQGPGRWAPPRFQHDRGHHYGHQPRYEQRYEYRPIVRQEYRQEYRPVVVYRPVPTDDIRVRISYDLNL
jgi:Ni/Co efflux regulator RcnB